MQKSHDETSRKRDCKRAVTNSDRILEMGILESRTHQSAIDTCNQGDQGSILGSTKHLCFKALRRPCTLENEDPREGNAHSLGADLIGRPQEKPSTYDQLREPRDSHQGVLQWPATRYQVLTGKEDSRTVGISVPGDPKLEVHLQLDQKTTHPLSAAQFRKPPNSVSGHAPLKLPGELHLYTHFKYPWTYCGGGVGALETYWQVRVDVQTGKEVSRAGPGTLGAMAGQVPRATMAVREPRAATVGQRPWTAMAVLETHPQVYPPPKK
ncbi:hypothetical protein DPX16_15574 [Anabarilius grahami]|uniref:Uncharacterized protein n=1 Tax=Anabarilius grahami TaxID=495550 RepID=A0A3N0Z6A5_ANAGA|nr:hypothetical protein DPX16_15574 [Anabarilius grahami]